MKKIPYPKNDAYRNNINLIFSTVKELYVNFCFCSKDLNEEHFRMFYSASYQEQILTSHSSKIVNALFVSC